MVCRVVVIGLFGQMLIDLGYLILFALTFMAPWRGLAAIVVLTESTSRWPKHLLLKSVDLLQYTRAMRYSLSTQIVERGVPYLKHIGNTYPERRRAQPDGQYAVDAEQYWNVVNEMNPDGRLDTEYGRFYWRWRGIISGLANGTGADYQKSDRMFILCCVCLRFWEFFGLAPLGVGVGVELGLSLSTDLLSVCFF